MIRKVAVPNAIVPTATVAGLLLGYLLGGSLIIETIYSIPGLGQLVVNSLRRGDHPVASAAVSVIAFTFVLINFLVDITYAYLSPKVRELYRRRSHSGRRDVTDAALSTPVIGTVADAPRGILRRLCGRSSATQWLSQGL